MGKKWKRRWLREKVESKESKLPQVDILKDYYIHKNVPVETVHVEARLVTLPEAKEPEAKEPEVDALEPEVDALGVEQEEKTCSFCGKDCGCESEEECSEKLYKEKKASAPKKSTKKTKKAPAPKKSIKKAKK